MSGVVVTGIGTVSALGVGKAALLAALREGRCGIAAIPPGRRDRSFAADSRVSLAALARDFEPRAFVDPMALRRMDRAGAMAIAAGRLALEDSGLTVDSTRTGIALGTGGAGIESSGAFFRVIAEQGPAAANPMIFPNTVPNAPAGQLAIALAARGPNATFAERGVAGEAAIACAALWLEAGRADAVLAGGVDELCGHLVEGYERFGALAREAARPFDRRRDGFVLGEGASVLVLEREDAARARGARIYARVAAIAQGFEPGPGGLRATLRAPRGSAAIARTFARALAESGAAARLGWACASAAGSAALDAVEAGALAEALGERISGVPISSLAGAAGHGMAGGALRAAASCLAIAHGLVPACVGLEEADPALSPRLDLVRGAARERPVAAVLETGVAEGGAAAAIVFERAAP
jgi:3-oxoacyl-[acyl-carrier-protein] synthase II